MLGEKSHSTWIRMLLVSYPVLWVNCLNTVLQEHVHHCLSWQLYWKIRPYYQ
jgi:hypothetical protein